MKIISWNTNGLRATHKAGHLFPLLDIERPDMLCLQETKSELEQLSDDIINIKGYQLYLSPCRTKKGYSGTAIYTKEKPLKVTNGFGTEEFDQEGRTIVAEYEKFYLITGYFPNGGSGPDRLDYKLRFYDGFLTYIEGLKNPKNGQGKPVIFCGDVNTAHHEIDLARPKENRENTGFLPIERAWMDKLVAKGWVDAFRKVSPSAIDSYTYWDQKTRARDRNVGWRIDYFFTSSDIAKDIKACYPLTTYLGSDHCPLVLEIKL